MILAIDIGGTKIAAGRIRDDGALDGEIRFRPTPTEGANRVVDAVVELVAELRDQADAGIGISTAGVVDTETGRILGATSSIPGWTGADLGPRVARATDLPTVVLGDGNAFGLGLWATRGVRSLLLLAVGTGIGGSLIVDGEPHLGAHHAGGHFGHVASPAAVGVACPCGRIGHLEAVASGAGILAWYHRNGGDQAVTTTRHLLTRPEDPVATAALQTAGAALGEAAAGLVNGLDVDLVLIAGSVSQSGAIWTEAMRETYYAGLIPAVSHTPIEVATDGVESALRGAAGYARRRWA